MSTRVSAPSAARWRSTSSPGADRQVAVEHQDVVAGDQGLLEAGVAVVGDVDGHALAPQAARDRVGERHLVLDDQHPHAPTLDDDA